MSKTTETIEYLAELTEADCVVPEMALDRITYAIVEIERLSAENASLNRSVKKFIAADAECERLTAENKRLKNISKTAKYFCAMHPQGCSPDEDTHAPQLRIHNG